MVMFAKALAIAGFISTLIIMILCPVFVSYKDCFSHVWQNVLIAQITLSLFISWMCILLGAEYMDWS